MSKSKDPNKLSSSINYDLDILNDSISINMVDDSFEYEDHESTVILPSKSSAPSSSKIQTKTSSSKILMKIQETPSQQDLLHHEFNHSKLNSNSIPLLVSQNQEFNSTDSDLITRQETRRNLNLEKERDWLRGINQLLEKSADEMDKVKQKFENVQSATETSHELLNLYSKILTQTEHTKDLISNPNWKGLTDDIKRRNEIKEQERIQLEREKELKAKLELEELEEKKRKERVIMELETQDKLTSKNFNPTSSIPNTSTRGRGTNTRGTTAGRTMRGKSRIGRIIR